MYLWNLGGGHFQQRDRETSLVSVSRQGPSGSKLITYNELRNQTPSRARFWSLSLDSGLVGARTIMFVRS